MLIGFLVSMGVASQLSGFDAVFEGSSIPLGVALGAVVLCAVGTIDDVRDVSPPAKTAGIVLAGVDHVPARRQPPATSASRSSTACWCSDPTWRR